MILDKHLAQECKLVDAIRNEYGDFINGIGTVLKCRFRYIDTIQRATHGEINTSDAMLWLKADSGAIKGSIIWFEDEYYQIERINQARRLGSTAVQFIKCDLKITNVAIS